MIKIALLFLTIITVSYTSCNPSKTQQEMNACAQENLEKIEHDLSTIYDKLQKAMQHDPKYVTNLQRSQNAWSEFRDAELEMMFTCDQEYKRYCWGSMYGTLYPTAKAELTQDRLERLKKQLDETQDSQPNRQLLKLDHYGLNGIGSTVPFSLPAISKQLPSFKVVHDQMECEGGQCESFYVFDQNYDKLAVIEGVEGQLSTIKVLDNSVDVHVQGVLGNKLKTLFDQQTYEEQCTYGMEEESGNIFCQTNTGRSPIYYLFSGEYVGAEYKMIPFEEAKEFTITALVWQKVNE
jgi:uncharacterized protein YecT (DUF1311 family)